MELKDIKEKLERGEKVYYAPFWRKSYSGSLVDGETRLFLLTPDSKPNFTLTIDENKELCLIKEIEKDRVYFHYLYSESRGSGGYSYYRAEGIAFSDIPFLMYIRHRGMTGTRSDDRDELVKSKEIKNLEEFLNLLK